MIDEGNIIDDAGPWNIGFGGLPNPAMPVDNLLELTTSNDLAASHSQAAIDAIKQIIAEQCGGCESLIGGCKDCVTGAIVRYNEAAESIITKNLDKVGNAIHSAISDSEQSLSNLLGIADIIQNPDSSPPDHPPVNEDGTAWGSGPTYEEVINQAIQDGHDFRIGIPGSTGIETITINPPVVGGQSVAGTGGYFSGGETGTDTGTIFTNPTVTCDCPVGYSLESYGPGLFRCRKNDGSSTVPCGYQPPPPPPPPPPPNAKCVEIDQILPPEVPPVVFCKDGQPLSQSELDNLCGTGGGGGGGGQDCKLLCPPEPPAYNDDANLTCDDPNSPGGSSDIPGVNCTNYTAEFNDWKSSTSKLSHLLNHDTIGSGSVSLTGLVPGATWGGLFGPPYIPGKDSSDTLKVGWPCKADSPPAAPTAPQADFDYCNPEDWTKAKDTQDKVNTVLGNICENYQLTTLAGGSTILALLMKGQEKAGWLQKGFTYLAALTITAGFLIPCLGIKIINAVLPLPASCSNPAGIGLAFARSLTQFFGRFIPIIPSQWVDSVEAISNYYCQSKLPDTNDMTQARLSCFINQDEWEFGMKLSGVCLPWAQRVLDAGRPKIPASVIFGWHRAELIDSEQRNDMLKRVGLEDHELIARFEFASEAIPGPSDLVRFMFRDVADEDIVTKYKYDFDFDKKYTGKIKEWAQRQNIPEDVFKDEWRAHWTLPANFQLYEMLHRLRPEKGLTDSEDNPLAIEKDDIIEAMQVNDIAPFWIDRLIAVSYRPMGIRQIARAYETNSITANDAKGFYQDLGYEEKDSKVLCQYLQVDSAERRAKFLGRPLPSVLEKAFIAGEINEDAYKSELSRSGLPDDIVSSRIEYARGKAAIADMTELAKSYKKQYLIGKISQDEYKQKLLAAGFDPQRVDEIVHRDAEVKTSRNKEVAVGKLCTLVGQGLMTPQDYFTRATNLGYTVDDAILLVRSCQIEVQEALQKKIQAAIDKAAAAAAKEEAARERERKKRLAIEKELFPCKAKPKPNCPEGIFPPIV